MGVQVQVLAGKQELCFFLFLEESNFVQFVVFAEKEVRSSEEYCMGPACSLSQSEKEFFFI